jgi:iron complex outermembrane receptor protein
MKTVRTSRLSQAVRGALLLAMIPAAVSAQEAASEEITTLDRIEVTGTRIKTSEAEGLSPVQRITRADIDRSGLTSIADVLQTITG